MDEESGETHQRKLDFNNETTPTILKAVENNEEILVSVLFVNNEEKIIDAKKE